MVKKDKSPLDREALLEQMGKLACARVNDAVKLLYCEQAPGDLAALDLGNVTEIKRSDKGVEIKFLDRLKALAMLESLEAEAGAAPLYEALEQSAAALSQTQGAQDHAV